MTWGNQKTRDETQDTQGKDRAGAVDDRKVDKERRQEEKNVRTEGDKKKGRIIKKTRNEIRQERTEFLLYYYLTKQQQEIIQ